MNFHDSVRVPESAIAGTAKIFVSMFDWSEGQVIPTIHDVPVDLPKPGLKLQPVSKRLKGKLIHPNRDAQICQIFYSPDGRQLVAGDYPGGIVQMWDTASDKQLTEIDGGYGYRGSSEYYYVTNDWNHLITFQQGRKLKRVERDGKKLSEWTFDGSVRIWNLATGELNKTLQHSPPHNVVWAAATPSGRYAITVDELPGTFEGQAPRAVSLWNAEQETVRVLAVAQPALGWISPDEKTVFINQMPDKKSGQLHEFKLIDVASGEVRHSIPVTNPESSPGWSAFSPDGRHLITELRIRGPQRNWKTAECLIDVWDVENGQLVRSLKLSDPGELVSSNFSFTSEGTEFVFGTTRGKQARLYVVPLNANSPPKITTLIENIEDGERAVVGAAAADPTGKWIAAATLVFSSDFDSLRSELEDWPQPWIHLVEVETGKVVETLITPQGASSSLCFSPDARTLASAGRGNVLLWDLTIPPGQIDRK